MATLEKLRGGLIVSCQAPEGSPLEHPEIIAALAAASERGGAAGVRINKPENIRAVRAAVRVPIIGIWKIITHGSDVYITPNLAAARAVAEAGADVIALDGTPRRPGGAAAVKEFIAAVRGELGLPVMADISSVAEGEAASETGADIVATTLFGYTAETRGAHLPGIDLVRRLAASIPTPIICEGGVQSPEQVSQALGAGAFAVVVGTALTGLEARVRSFVQATPKH